MSLADEFLAPGSESVLRGASNQLAGICKRGSHMAPVRWSIARENPLLTVASRGAYMPDDEGGLTVHGEITFVWELEPVREGGDSRPAQRVRLNGLASTSLRVLDGEPWTSSDPKEYAFWRMEIADSNAPGAYFHVQVLGREDDTSFPKQLDIPRLPGVLNSPFACMEFVLGELFQKRWERIAQRETGACRQWRGIQAERHRRHLEWAAKIVKTTSGSPWVAWKVAKPGEDLFI
jgi:hypothetical protein